MLHHKAIASTEARFVWPDRKESIVTIEVGAPFLSPENDWRCELDLRGLEDESMVVIADDSLGALSNALYFIRIRLERFRKEGIRILFTGSEDDLSFDYFFPPGINAGKTTEPN
jgi:hypothetical protein